MAKIKFPLFFIFKILKIDLAMYRYSPVLKYRVNRNNITGQKQIIKAKLSRKDGKMRAKAVFNG